MTVQGRFLHSFVRPRLRSDCPILYVELVANEVIKKGTIQVTDVAASTLEGSSPEVHISSDMLAISKLF